MSAIRYTDLFIDFDDTLYDTHGNAEIALRELFEQCHFERYFDRVEDFTIPFWETNVELWDLYARGAIERDYLIVERIRRPLACGTVERDGQRVPFEPDRDYCLKISDIYLDLCACKPGVVDGAHELVKYLKSKGYRMHICSNGLHEVQFRKLSSCGMLHDFDSIILSDDAGANKPLPQFFEYAFRQTGATPEKTLMIGDNYKTDILGAQSSGLDVMFFNRNPAGFVTPGPVNYEVTSLWAIQEIL